MSDPRPFSNGTEHQAWSAVWCDHCIHDHGLHTETADGGMCELITDAMFNEDYRWPEEWIKEPPGWFGLPSYMICGKFTPCTAGECTGDPAPDERAERVALVIDAWKNPTEVARQHLDQN